MAASSRKASSGALPPSAGAPASGGVFDPDGCGGKNRALRLVRQPDIMATHSGRGHGSSPHRERPQMSIQVTKRVDTKQSSEFSYLRRRSQHETFRSNAPSDYTK